MTTRCKLMAATAILAAAVPLTTMLGLARAEEDKVQLMFVQTADDLKADDKTLRLVNVNPQTLFFSDRPKRVAGHLTMPAYLDEWKAGEGPDNFADDPPNATLSVYEGGKAENTLTVVEISHPVVEGKDLVYNYRLIEGKMPHSGGATALFCSSIGLAWAAAWAPVFTASEPVPEGLAFTAVTVDREGEKTGSESISCRSAI